MTTLADRTISALANEHATLAEAPGEGFNQSVWDRWDALPAREQLEGFLLHLGFAGKADQLAEAATVDIHGFGLAIADSVSLTATADDPTAAFTGPLEAAVRLLGGRLAPTHTPADVTVVGNVTLEDLRRVFPGY